ncbi:hypothetical protein QE152_g10253 [Popillia japonica]|uniref:Tektin n=1 Tax=Popillia japonica TaxID=7064 RepID=A0AAW1LVA4_POPJA
MQGSFIDQGPSTSGTNRNATNDEVKKSSLNVSIEELSPVPVPTKTQRLSKGAQKGEELTKQRILRHNNAEFCGNVREANSAHWFGGLARQLRNETKIRMDWDTYHNNARLADRITEVGRWRDTLQACLDRVNREMNSLREEKFSTEKDLDALSIPIGVVSECISIRDCRQGAELTYDEGDTELKKELCVLESVKKLLIDRCQTSWEKLNRLEEVKFKLVLDINDKGETMEIDKEQLKLDRNCANISYKTDSLRIPSTSLPYETWLEHSKYTKLLADKELEDTLKLRESLFVIRERANNDMLAQRDCVDFTLRKRIYETQRARNELQWQQLKMREEMEKVEKEIKALEGALKDKDDARKLAESRLEHRTYRPGIELARDEAETGLKDEVMQLRQTQRDLQDKIYCSKAT